jgi:ADP-heptose:LPS heptosyltransferase
VIEARRILLILPCCIGDVVQATATLQALRRGYPQAHITWAVGGWSRQAVENHDLLDAVLDTGPAALPVKSPGGFLRFVRQLRRGHYDLAVSLVRSPLMSLAVWLSGIPHRAGLDSAGRGFGYNIRVSIQPQATRHEAEIYLDVARELGLDTTGCYANVPVDETLWPQLASKLDRAETGNMLVINPTGGQNPGMLMGSKRWLPANFAALADHLAGQLGADVVLLGGPQDTPIIEAVQAAMQSESTALVGWLSFAEIALLASRARLYIGNDTGLTHLAAAAGARTVAIFGPSDPRRYAPFVPHALTLWKPANVAATGVAGGTPQDWDWSRDGISVAEAIEQITAFLAATPPPTV